MPKYLKIITCIGAILGVLVSAQVLGVTPWASRGDLEAYESKEHAKENYQLIRDDLRNISDKLDRLIEKEK